MNELKDFLYNLKRFPYSITMEKYSTFFIALTFIFSVEGFQDLRTSMVRHMKSETAGLKIDT